MTDVVLLHGLGADTRAFQRFGRLLPESWTTTPLDLLGHGDAPKPEAGYSLEDHAAYIGQLLAQAERAIPVPTHIIGHSYGCAVAIALAAARPELVTSLVLLDPAMHSSQAGPKSADGLTGTQRMIRARQAGDMAPAVRDLFGSQSYALQEWVIETWTRMAVGVVNELDGDWMRFGPKTSCPTTVVHGDEPLGGSGPAPGEFLPHAKLVRIAGAGHYLHATHARETAAATIDAIEDHEEAVRA